MPWPESEFEDVIDDPMEDEDSDDEDFEDELEALDETDFGIGDTHRLDDDE